MAELKTKKTSTVVVIAILGVVFLGAACSVRNMTSTNANATVARIPRGVSFSPSSTSVTGLNDFFTRTTQIGSFVSWAGPTADLAKTNGGPSVVLSKSTQLGLTPVVIVSPRSEDLASTAAYQSWHDAVVAFAQAKQIPYLGVGNEINKSFTQSQRTFFGQRYPTLIADIHGVSPQTKVFVTFQYEWLRGMRGGLFGGTNDPAQEQWNDTSIQRLLDEDVVAFTTYPGLVYKNPTDLPSDYYANIREHTQFPVAFTEIGWFRTGPAGWDSSGDEQAAFIQTFRQQTQMLDPEFSLWSFLYDPPASEPFTTMGLLTAGETDSPAWRAWIAK